MVSWVCSTSVPNNEFFFNPILSSITTAETPSLSRDFTVKLNSEYTQLNFSPDDTYTCSWAWDNKNFGIVNCTSTYNDGSHFNYNINKKRFLILDTSSTGYLENAEIPDTNAMKAGSCKNF